MSNMSNATDPSESPNRGPTIAVSALTPSEVLQLQDLYVQQAALSTHMSSIHSLVDEIPTHLEARIELRDTYKTWLGLQTKMLKLFRFDTPDNHLPRFNVPGCTCSKDINRQYLGTSRFEASPDCLYHGENGVLSDKSP